MSEKQYERFLRGAVEKWPKLPPGADVVQPGRVMHMIVRHDDWCPTVNGGTPGSCCCAPEVSGWHVQPDDVEQLCRDIDRATKGTA